MTEKKLTAVEWDSLIRNFWCNLTRSITSGHGRSQKLATAIGVTRQAISDMRAGRSLGSVTSDTRMLFYQAGLSDEEAKKILENPHIIIKGIETPSIIDGLFQELKNTYSENELTAWMKLLISKRKVEESLGIEIKARTKKMPKQKR